MLSLKLERSTVILFAATRNFEQFISLNKLFQLFFSELAEKMSAN